MNLANQITVFRMLLVPAFAVSLVYVSTDRPWMQHVALGCFALACFTDALDGWIARRFSQITTLGSYMDPIADKFLLLTAFALLGFWNGVHDNLQIPAWVAILVLARDIIIVIGVILIHLITGSLKAKPTMISKATTLVQMATLMAVLAGAPQEALDTLYVAVGAFTTVSGLVYIRIGSQLLQTAS